MQSLYKSESNTFGIKASFLSKWACFSTIFAVKIIYNYSSEIFNIFFYIITKDLILLRYFSNITLK